jgi:hypothetical protein
VIRIGFQPGGVPAGAPLVFLLLVLVACSPQPRRESPSDPGELTLVFTSDTKGRIGDCGCSRRPLGGLDRRATLLDSLRRATSGPLLVLDLGNVHGLSRTAEAHEDARLIVECLAAMGVDRLLPGPIERSYPESDRRLWEAAAPDHMAFGTGEGSGTCTPRFRVPGGPELQLGRWHDSQWRLNSAHGLDPEPVPVPDPSFNGLNLLVAFCEADTARLSGAAFEGWDVILLGGSASAFDHATSTQEGAVVFSAQDRGRSLAVLKLKRHSDGGWRALESGHVDVLPETLPDPRITELVERDRQARDERRAARMETRRITERRRLGLGESPATPVYTGAETCRECHTPQWQHWKADVHSDVYADFLRQPGAITPERERRFVTGWLERGGYLDREATPEFVQVQCEACHGPGAAHVADPQAVPMPAAAAEACIRCHTGPVTLPYHKTR